MIQVAMEPKAFPEYLEAAAEAGAQVVPMNSTVKALIWLDYSQPQALAELLHAPATEGPSHPQAKQLAHKLQDEVRQRLFRNFPRVVGPLPCPVSKGRTKAMGNSIDVHSPHDRRHGHV